MHILDRWVVGRLLRWGRDVHASGRRMPHCSVNLSIDTIRRDLAFGDYVLKGMQKLAVSPSSIAFEIMTTDALANPQAVASLIAPLQAAGVKFALSWFAGEESALELAPSLGISFIKIDGSLAMKIARREGEAGGDHPALPQAGYPHGLHAGGGRGDPRAPAHDPRRLRAGIRHRAAASARAVGPRQGMR